jgi:hypothetical protein
MKIPLSARTYGASFLLGLVLIGPVGCSGRDGSSSPGRKVVDAPIDGIEILTRESAPPGYTAHITSGLPSGCAEFHEAVITGRAGDVITIRVTNTLPADKKVACDLIYGIHETNIDLGQDFFPKRAYTVKVNDKTQTFVAQ